MCKKICRWILGFLSVVLFACVSFVPNTLCATVLPKALDSKEKIFLDGFLFYGGENTDVCRVDTPEVSQKELQEAGIPSDANVMYMGEEVCDRKYQWYFLANETEADMSNDRDDRAFLPNQVLVNIQSDVYGSECKGMPCMIRGVGVFELFRRNEFAAIELLESGKDLGKSAQNMSKSTRKSNGDNKGKNSKIAKSSTDSRAASTSIPHTLGIIYKIFGYAGWREGENVKVKKVPLPSSAFELKTFGSLWFDEGYDSYGYHEEYFDPKDAQQGGYGGFFAKKSMLVNTDFMINHLKGNTHYRPILLHSAFLAKHFTSNIVLYATPEAALKSSAGNARQNGTKPNPKNIILDSIYHNAKRATLGRESLAKQGIHLTSPLLDKVFVLGLGSGKFSQIAQVLVIRGDSVYFWGYIALEDKKARNEILDMYASLRDISNEEAKKAYDFFPREKMPRQISINELRELVKVEYPAKVKAVVAFDTQSLEYARKSYINEIEADKAKSSGELDGENNKDLKRDSSGYATYYQLPISGSLNRQISDELQKKALKMAQSRGERELEIELVAEFKQGLLLKNLLANAGDSEVASEKSPIVFRLASRKDKGNKATSPSVKHIATQGDVVFFTLEGHNTENPAHETSETPEKLLCIGSDLAKTAIVPIYDDRGRIFEFLDKLQLKGKNMSIEKLLTLVNTGRGDFYVVDIRDSQDRAIMRGLVSTSALMPCEQYDIASSPDYAKALYLRERLAEIKRLKIDDDEWMLKLGEEAVGHAKSVKSLKEAIEVAKSWDIDAGALKMLDLKHGDKRVEYDRGKKYYPEKINVDFVFIGEKSDEHKIVVIFPRSTFIIGETEVIYLRLKKMEF